MSSGFRLRLQRHFPSASDPYPGLYPRLAAVAFIAAALLWSYLLHGQPLKKIIAVEALWFQLGGAGLLWWEANATPQRLSAVILEARRAQPKPSTVPEKVVWFLGLCTILIMWALAYVLVAAGLLVKGISRSAMIAEAEWAIAFTILTICVWGGGRYMDRQQVNLRRKIMSAPATDEEILIRRYLRTIGFVLLFISTLFQFYPALTSDGQAAPANEARALRD